KLYTLMNVYVAAPDHPIHQEPEPLSEVTRVKYRGIAVADTARERPVLTVQLLDKQPRLTVSTIEDKRQALLAGLGVALGVIGALLATWMRGLENDVYFQVGL
ncbi:hypothetical protein ACUOBA_50520, partial [Escherichia coli]